MNFSKQFTGGFARRTKKLFLALLVSAAVFTKTTAQTNSLVVRGEVKDQQGAVIAGAEILLIDDSGAERKTVTNNQGAFRLESLAIGTYTLQISAEGFGTHE